jgi:hypothetical protein
MGKKTFLESRALGELSVAKLLPKKNRDPFFLSDLSSKEPIVQDDLPAKPNCGVARFFLVQHTKTGKNIPKNHKIYQITKIYQKAKNIQNKHKKYQMAIK